jgi:hypothetical protein
MHAKVVEEKISTWRNYYLENWQRILTIILFSRKESISILTLIDCCPIGWFRFYADSCFSRLGGSVQAEFQVEALVCGPAHLKQLFKLRRRSSKNQSSGIHPSQEQGTLIAPIARRKRAVLNLATGFVEGWRQGLRVIHGPWKSNPFPLIEQFVKAFTGDAFFSKASHHPDAMKSLS